MSTLTEDYKLDLDKGQMAFAFKNDGYIVPGLTWYEIYVTDPAYANYDYLQIHVLTDAETLRDGTYTIDNGLTSGTGLKGAVTPGGEISLSWMSDLSSADSEGVQSVLAPIAGGTVTISTVGDFRQLDFDLRSKPRKSNLPITLKRQLRPHRGCRFIFQALFLCSNSIFPISVIAPITRIVLIIQFAPEFS